MLLNSVRAGSKDFERIRSGLLTLWRGSQWGGPTSSAPGLAFPPSADSIERLEREPKTVRIFALESDEIIIGSLILHLGPSIGDYAKAVVESMKEAGCELPAFIRSLYILPSERGNRYGSLLLGAALEEAKSRGAQLVGAHAMVQPVRNDWIIRAYRNAGFLSVKETTTYEVSVPKGGDWERYNREEIMPQEIPVEYEAFVAAVPGFHCSRRGGKLLIAQADQ